MRRKEKLFVRPLVDPHCPLAVRRLVLKRTRKKRNLQPQSCAEQVCPAPYSRTGINLVLPQILVGVEECCIFREQGDQYSEV